MKKIKMCLLYLLSILLFSSSIPVFAEGVEEQYGLNIIAITKNEDSYKISTEAYNTTDVDQLLVLEISEENEIYNQDLTYGDFGQYYIEDNKVYLSLKANLAKDLYDFDIFANNLYDQNIKLKWDKKEYIENFELNEVKINSNLNENIFTLDKGDNSINPEMAGTRLEMRMKFKVNSNSDTSGDIYGNMNIRLKFDKTYISYISINATSPGQLEGSVVKQKENYDADYYIVDYEFKNVNYGADVNFPLNFFALEGKTPNNAKLIVSGEMMKDDITVAKSSVEFIALNQMENTKIERYIAGTDGFFRTSTNHIYGGEEDSVNKGYLESDINKITPIKFFLYSDYVDKQNIGGVNIEKYVATEYLPTEAVFDEVNSKGWTYDKDSHTASKEFTGKNVLKNNLGSKPIAFTEGTYDSIDYNLYLKFPGLKLDSTIKSKFVIDAYPVSKVGFSEKYTFSQEKDIKVSKTPPRKYNDNLYNSSSNNKIIYNTPIAKATEDIYLFGMFIHKDSRDYAENLSFEAKIDDSYKIKDIEIPILSKTEFDGTLDIYYYLENDSQRYLLDEKIDISQKVNDKNMGYSQRFAENLIVSKIEVETSPNSKIYRSEKTSLYFNFRTRIILKDMNRDMKAGTVFTHESKVVGNLASLDKKETRVRSQFTVSDPTPSLDMSLRTSKNTTNIKTPVFYTLNILGEFLNKDLIIDFDKMVIMLPTGFDYVKGSSVLINNANGSEFGFDKGDVANEPTVSLNYKDSGQNALVWEIPKGITQSESLNTRTLRLGWTFSLEANKFAKEGNNEMKAYLVLNEQGKLKYDDKKMSEDKYDFNNNGSRDDLIYKSISKIDYVPPFELMVQKELKGGLDSDFLINPNIAKTEINLDSAYKLKVFNNTENDHSNVTIVDILSYEGDKTVSIDPISKKQLTRNSNVKLNLVDEIAVSNGFKVQYSKEVPNYDNNDFLNSVVWYDHLDDIKEARAFKISGGVIKSKEVLNFIANVRIDDNYQIKDNSFANGSFGISSDKNIFSTFESNIMPLEVVSYTVKGNLWTDFNHDSLINDSDGPIVNHKISLVDTDGNAVRDLNGKAYETFSDENGNYELKIHKNGNYKVKIETPSNHELTNAMLDDNNGSHIINDGKSLSDEFTVNVNNRIATKNAGFKRDVIFKVKNRTLDANSGILNNNDLFTYSLTVDKKLYNGVGKTLTGNDVKVVNGEFTLRTNDQAVFNDIASNVNYSIKQIKHSKYEIISDINEYSGKTHSDIYHQFDNQFVVEKIDITVEKDWGLYTQVKPDIEIQLYRDGIAHLSSIILKDGDLKYTWNNLDKTDVYGNEYKYTVDELTVLENFSKKVDGFKITNTYISPTFEVVSDIDWSGYLQITPDFEIQLYRDGIPHLDSVVMTHNELTQVWEDLDKTDETGVEYVYTVDELSDLEQFTTEVEEFDFINTYVSPQRDVSVEIDWGLYTQVKPDIEIQLIRDGKEFLSPVKLVDGQTEYTYTDLDVSDDLGVDYTYTVVEAGDLDNFLIDISGLKIKNTYVSPKIDITVEKDWGLYTQVKPDIEIQLYRNDEAYLNPISLKDGELTYTWTNLDETDLYGNLYTYRVDELTVLDNFTKKVEDFKITNTYQSETFDLKVLKEWKNFDQIKPSIEIQLYRNGIAYLNPIEIKDGEDTYIFKDLLVNDETGLAYEYTIDEITELDNFEKTVDGFTITNTYIANREETPSKSADKSSNNVNTGIMLNEYLMILTLLISTFILLILRKRLSIKN